MGGIKQMEDLNSPLTLNVPYLTTTLLSRMASGRTTNIYGLHVSRATGQGNLQPLQPQLPLTKITIEKKRIEKR